MKLLQSLWLPFLWLFSFGSFLFFSLCLIILDSLSQGLLARLISCQHTRLKATWQWPITQSQSIDQVLVSTIFDRNSSAFDRLVILSQDISGGEVVENLLRKRWSRLEQQGCGSAQLTDYILYTDHASSSECNREMFETCSEYVKLANQWCIDIMQCCSGIIISNHQWKESKAEATKCPLRHRQNLDPSTKVHETAGSWSKNLLWTSGNADGFHGLSHPPSGFCSGWQIPLCAGLQPPPWAEETTHGCWTCLEIWKQQSGSVHALKQSELIIDRCELQWNFIMRVSFGNHCRYILNLNQALCTASHPIKLRHWSQFWLHSSQDRNKSVLSFKNTPARDWGNFFRSMHCLLNLSHSALWLVPQ